MNINILKKIKLIFHKILINITYLCQLHLQNNFNMCIISYFIIFFKVF